MDSWMEGWLERGVVYIHVDDFVVGHPEQSIAAAAAATIAVSLRQAGFIVEYSAPSAVT